MSNYPEHDRLSEISDISQSIGQFLDESEYILAEYHRPDGYSEEHLFPVQKPITQILADYFEIDLNKIEAEKRQMIEEMRNAQ